MAKADRDRAPLEAPLAGAPNARDQLLRLARSRVLRQNLLYLLGNGGSGAGVLIAQSYGAHRLTAVGNGQSTAVLAVLNLLYTTAYVVAAGTARHVASGIAEGRSADSQWPEVRHSSVRLGAVLGLAMVPISVLLAFILHLTNPWILGVTVVAGPLAALGGAQRGFLQGRGDFRNLAINFLIYGGLMVVLSVLLLHLRLGFVSLPLASVAASIGSAVYPRHLPVARSGAASRDALVDGAVVVGAATAPTFNNVDVVTARHVLNGHAAGLYSGLSVMGKILYFGTSSLSAVMYPRLAHARTASQRRRLLVETVVLLAAADAVVLAVYTIFGRDILRLVLGRTYTADARLLPLFTVGVIGLTLVNLLVYYGMGARGRRFALVPAVGVPALLAWLFTSPPHLSDFVARIASALVVLAAVEAAVILPGLRREAPQSSPETSDPHLPV